MNEPSATQIGREERLAEVLEQYLAGLQDGSAPSKKEMIERYPDLAHDLEACLATLNYVGAADVGPMTAVGRDSDWTEAEQRRLGDFRIMGEVGRGGMGVVYEAEQISLGRRVALKVLPFAGVLDQRRRQRFTHEAQAAALLHHQHIVPVYQVGCERGVHFYAMQFVEGQTLAALIEQLRQIERGGDTSKIISDVFSHGTTVGITGRKEFFRTVAQMGIQAAEALEHAHQMGVIHRDIKPNNLLIDSDGKLWITDFGLARMDADVSLTISGDLLGTVRYMSPEQALAKRTSVDHRTDLYSLGATLYEILTLEPLVCGDDREELLRRIAFHETRPTRRTNRRVPEELDTIVLKATNKSPDERYSTAQEMADDLRRFLLDEPIRAKRPTLWQRTRKWAHRHKSVVAACGIVIVTGLFTLGPFIAWRESHMRGRVEQSLHERNRQLYAASITLAYQAWTMESNVTRVRELLRKCMPEKEGEDLRGFEWFYLNHVCAQAEQIPTLKANHPVSSVSVSPDGRTLAVAGSEIYLYEGSDVVLWDLPTGRERRRIAADAHCVTWSPDGKTVASGSFPARVRLWQASTGEELFSLAPLDDRFVAIRKLGYSPDGKWLAGVGGGTSNSWLWNLETRQCYELKSEVGKINDVAFSPDSQTVACPASDGTIRLWSVANGIELRTPFERHSSAQLSAAFAPQGNNLAVGSSDGLIQLWDSATGESLRTLEGHVRGVNALVFLGKNLLASAGNDKTVQVWNLSTGEHRVYKGHGASVNCLAYVPQMDQLVSGSRDRQIKLWPLEYTDLVNQFKVSNLSSWAFQFIDFSPNGNAVAVGCCGSFKVWDISTGAELRSPVDSAGSVAFSPDGRLLATTFSPGPGDGFRIQLWDLPTQELLATFPGAGPQFSADSTRLVCGRHGLTLWDVSDPEIPRRMGPIGDHRFKALAKFFPNNDWLLGASSVETAAKVWDASSRALIAVLDTQTTIYSGAISPDGKTIALGLVDGTIQVWEAGTWRKTMTLTHGGAIWKLDISPDGKTLATGSEDGTVKLWNLATASLLFTLQEHADSVRAVRFSPDGQVLATGSADGTIRLWRGSGMTSL